MPKPGDKKVVTCINPAGFVEQRYCGLQTVESVMLGLKELEKYARKALREQGKPPLILEDVSELSQIDLSLRFLEARKEGIKIMRELKYERAAIYGPLKIQLLVNTMAMIAGAHGKIGVFDERVKAVKWLRAKQSIKTYNV